MGRSQVRPRTVSSDSADADLLICRALKSFVRALWGGRIPVSGNRHSHEAPLGRLRELAVILTGGIHAFGAMFAS